MLDADAAEGGVSLSVQLIIHFVIATSTSDTTRMAPPFIGGRKVSRVLMFDADE